MGFFCKGMVLFSFRQQRSLLKMKVSIGELFQLCACKCDTDNITKYRKKIKIILYHYHGKTALYSEFLFCNIKYILIVNHRIYFD